MTNNTNTAFNSALQVVDRFVFNMTNNLLRRRNRTIYVVDRFVFNMTNNARNFTDVGELL